MQWLWLGLGAAAVVGAVGGVRTLRRMGLEFQYERAREAFRLQRERLEAVFLDAAAATGKPRGLIWSDCQFESKPALVRDVRTGALLGLVPVTISFEAIPDGPMDGVEAVGNLRYATAVFEFRKGHWKTSGRALFNMHPDEAISHFAGQFERVL